MVKTSFDTKLKHAFNTKGAFYVVQQHLYYFDFINRKQIQFLFF